MAVKKSKIYSTKKKTTNSTVGSTRRRKPNSRPQMETKEQLLAYLDENVKYGFELPFVEEAWENAEKNWEIIQANRYDEEGNLKPRDLRTPKTVVGCYFQAMGFKKFFTIGQEILKNMDIRIVPFDPKGHLTEEDKKVAAKNEEIQAAEETTPHYDNWLINWINMFNEEESKFLRQRFADYYTQYDINEAADKTVLMNILSIEIQLYRINNMVSKGKPVNVLDIEKLNKQMVALLEAQKWTKKQRSAADDAIGNKFTSWLDSMMKSGRFIEKKTVYEEDQIDKLLASFVTAMREVSM